MEKLKSYIFSRQMIRAWEIIPWKKIYWLDEDNENPTEQIQHILMVQKQTIKSISCPMTVLKPFRRWPIDCPLKWLYHADNSLAARTGIDIDLYPEIWKFE